MTAPIFSLLAAAFYLGGTLYQIRCLMRRRSASPNLLRTIGVVALLSHAGSLYVQMVTAEGLSFGFFHVSSLIAWLVLAVILMFSLRAPVTSLLIVLFPLALITDVLAWLFPGHGAALVPGKSAVLVHVLLSILAYGILTIAAFQAALLAVQNNQLKHRNPVRFNRTFPPLQTMEDLLFQFLLCGEVLLTLALISGFVFLDNMFAQNVAHKTLLSCLAWVVFGILLWGRHFRGWRGNYAIRWTLGGFLLLMLAFFGSKMVSEFILPV